MSLTVSFYGSVSRFKSAIFPSGHFCEHPHFDKNMGYRQPWVETLPCGKIIEKKIIENLLIG